MTSLLAALSEAGRKAAPTHFDPSGVRTDASKDEVLEIVRSVASPAAAKSGRRGFPG
jgi:tRNA G26 N,N-dimethylase Trm1